MFKPEDIDFHTPPDADYRFAETNFWTILIPEERLMAIVYTVARPAVGVQSCDVSIYGALVDNRAETLYLDSQQALPCPKKLSEYTTANGLSVKAHNLRDYRVDYVGYDGVELHFDFRALMEPFDIHDPADSPRAKARIEDQHAGSGMGSGYGGHLESTGHITGTLTLQGKTYQIDCVEVMDHSWGNRPELGVPTMGVGQAHFGKSLAFKWINHWDLNTSLESAQPLAHGYVLEDGLTYGLTDAVIHTNRVGSMVTWIDAKLTDKRGRNYHLYGTSEIGGPWICYTSSNLYMAMMRWTLDDGRVGHGLSSEISSMQSLTRKYGRRWWDPSGHLTA